MDTFTLLTTLPHHSKMGMFENPKSAPAWEAQHGHRFSTEQLIAVAGEDETLLRADVDLARSERVRRIWPYLRDRRIDDYGDLVRRYRD